MHKLLARQLNRAKLESGEVDLPHLLRAVSDAYEQSDNDRRRTDRSISLMIAELDQLNKDLDQQVQDRTRDLRQREAELRAQNSRFDTALSNMPHGLSMYDNSGKLIVSNPRYAQMYGLNPADVLPGTTVDELRLASVASGVFSLEILQRLISELENPLRGGAMYVESETAHGRYYALVRQPMEGGGWVTIHQDITAQKQVEQQVTYLARHDTLTGIGNRAMLLEKMAEAITRLDLHDVAFAVLLLDLDLFKTINDSLGHPVGDELLKQVARRITANIRDADTVCRIGGDEFAIVVNLNGDPLEQASAVAQRLLESVAKPFDIEGHRITIGTSIGIALAPEHGMTASALMKSADLALYKAKENGRHTSCFFELSMGVRAIVRRAMQTDLQGALADEHDDQIEVHYQPIVCARDLVTIGFEALARWRHPCSGMISPGDFIPLAEETGLIAALGERILRKACRDAAAWPADINLSVNFSPVQFRTQGVSDMVRAVLAETGLAPTRLEVEITESVLLDGTPETMKCLAELRTLGASIVLDDFGIGYSSLSYLRMFPFDKIKIDRSFVHEQSHKEGSAAIIRAVAQLGRSLGMRIVAEGIETEAELAMVREAGCHAVQGYLLGRPSPSGSLGLPKGLHHAA